MPLPSGGRMPLPSGGRRFRRPQVSALRHLVPLQTIPWSHPQTRSLPGPCRLSCPLTSACLPDFNLPAILPSGRLLVRQRPGPDLQHACGLRLRLQLARRRHRRRGRLHRFRLCQGHHERLRLAHLLRGAGGGSEGDRHSLGILLKPAVQPSVPADTACPLPPSALPTPQASGWSLLTNPLTYWTRNTCTAGASCLPFAFFTRNKWRVACLSIYLGLMPKCDP